MGAHELAFVGLAGSGVGTVLGVPMVWRGWRGSARGRDVRLFGWALLLMSTVAGLISARLAGLAPASAGTEHAINLIGLLAWPMLVLYARYAVALPLTRALAAWWLPAAGYAALLTVRAGLGASTRVPFLWLAPVACSFTVASALTLWRHRARRRDVVVPAESVVAFLAVLNVAQLVRMEFGHIAPLRALVPLVMSLGFAGLAAYAVWRVTAHNAGHTEPTARNAVPAKYYERSGFDEAAARALLARMHHALSRDRLHTRIDLTLAELSALIGATPHQVSEALNRYAGTSFTDLLTRRRIDDVKGQLLDPANDRFTIEGIGASAGFGSRSALYAAFRRLEGTTPTEFRRARTSSQ